MTLLLALQGGVNVYVYTGSGGIVFDGTAAVSKSKDFVASGGIVSGGTAAVAKSKAFVGSGGIVFGGTADVTKSKVYIGSGGIVFDGAAAVAKSKTFVGSGGIVFGGTASLARTYTFVSTGLADDGCIDEFNFWYKGAPVLEVGDSFDFAAWYIGAPVLQDCLNITQAGIVFGGAAATIFVAATSQVFVYAGSGGIVFGGVAATQFSPVLQFGNWLAGGGGAPVWWPVTLYSYYPQQPLFKPGDKPAKHLRSKRRARARYRAPRPAQVEASDDYDAIVRTLYQSFMDPQSQMYVVPVHPTVVKTVTRTQQPEIVQVSETFVQALREDAELLELDLV